MRTISSRENEIYKRCRQLERRKYRDRYGQFMVEGRKIVAEAVKRERVQMLIFREGTQNDEGMPSPAPGTVKAVAMDPELFSAISQTETSQGVIAVVDKENGADFPAADDGENLLVLDRVQDPGNIGTMIRTAEAAGYAGIMAVKGTGDLYSPKVVRAAAGSLLRMPVKQVADENEALEWLQEAGKTVVTTSLDAEKYYYQVDLSRNIALVIGNEGNGVSGEFQRRSHLNIKIPMSGEIESLNAAVAAGILMYQSNIRKVR
ncbi:MAG: TrmH family RNA methyltransferase [Anaerovoracaceae bacterium]|jgi:TrmH family RNA methyltransferase